MEFISDSATLREYVTASKSDGQRLGLAPTMGNLHAGHLALVDAAKRDCDVVIASIFVNPLQFGPGEDLEAYPRTLEEDKALLASHQCSALFAPSIEDIYGSDPAQQTLIHVPGVSEGYCGNSRPGHFDGVATVVCKLLNLASPDIAYFGLKDYQQFLVIRKMAEDLALPVSIQGIEIVREANGLAMSSRNNYLSAEQRESAAVIFQTLQQSKEELLSGYAEMAELENLAKSRLERAGLRPDYFAIRRAADLQEANAEDRDLVILAAAWLGPARLIDNLRITR